MFPSNDDKLGRHIRFHERSQRDFAEDRPTGEHGIVQLNKHGTHESKQGIFIGEDANHLGSPLQFLVQALNVIRGAVIASQTAREQHNRHGTFEAVIQT